MAVYNVGRFYAFCTEELSEQRAGALMYVYSSNLAHVQYTRTTTIYVHIIDIYISG